MRFVLLAVLTAALVQPAAAQPTSARALLDAAAQAGAIADPAARAAAVASRGASLRPGEATSRVPYVTGDTAGASQRLDDLEAAFGHDPFTALYREGLAAIARGEAKPGTLILHEK